MLSNSFGFVPSHSQIFKHIHSPNIYLFTVIITAHSSQQNNHSLTFSLFKNMLNNPIRPKHFIYPHVLKSSKERVLIGSIHSQIVKTGFLEYPVVQTSLVDSYSKVLGGFRDAQKVFDEMSERNVLCFTALVFLRAGDVESGLKVFDEMVERECRLGLRLLVVVLRMVFFFFLFLRGLGCLEKWYLLLLLVSGEGGYASAWEMHTWLCL
jgi:pentatricopeptide repeat protein